MTMDCTVGIRFPIGERYMFFYSTASRLGLGPIQPLMQWTLGGCFPGGKAAMAESWVLTSI
jgi:hypothetical protein